MREMTFVANVNHPNFNHHSRQRNSVPAAIFTVAIIEKYVTEKLKSLLIASL